MGTIPELNAKTFATTIAGPAPVLVDFWAPWCGPCQYVAPVLEQLASELGERVRIAKVNVDQEPGLAQRLGVQGIPTLILFADGHEVDRTVGALPKAALAAWLLRMHAPVAG
jgi:thioredoxin